MTDHIDWDSLNEALRAPIKTPPMSRQEINRRAYLKRKGKADWRAKGRDLKEFNQVFVQWIEAHPELWRDTRHKRVS